MKFLNKNKRLNIQRTKRLQVLPSMTAALSSLICLSTQGSVSTGRIEVGHGPAISEHWAGAQHQETGWVSAGCWIYLFIYFLIKDHGVVIFNHCRTGLVYRFHSSAGNIDRLCAPRRGKSMTRCTKKGKQKKQR